VSAEQLCFFSFPKPLLEKFGPAFFKEIPKTAGVYLMLDARKKVIYVGQSQNLRVRLAYYKNAQPEREPRKVIRLVHRTETIELERCPSPEAAQLRELELIRQYRPRFNVASTLSPTYCFLGWRCADHKIQVRLALAPQGCEGEQFRGAFKNRGLCRRTIIAMGRLLWARLHNPTSVYDFPIELGPSSRSSSFQLGSSDAAEWQSLLDQYFEGASSSLIQLFESAALLATEPFLKKVLETDLLTLTEFYTTCAQPHHELRAFHGIVKSAGVHIRIPPLAIHHRCEFPRKSSAKDGRQPVHTE
jgi:hypothetical protein